MGKLGALLLVFCLTYSPLTATAQNATLQLGTPIERQLGPGHNHEFTVNVEENNLIQFVVEQRGIDLIVKVSSPSGKTIGEYDTPNGNEGPEHVSFVAATAGTYRIAVSPLDPWDTTTGRYQIKLLELRPATDQELNSSKNLLAVKARGIGLIEEIEKLVTEIKSPHTRIKTQLTVGNLVWESDEKLATKFFTDAITTFKEFLASREPDDNYFQPYSTMSQLRYEMVNILVQRDPEAALSFLHSTQSSDRTDPQRAMQENSAELSITEQIARKDPARALKIARLNLKKRLSSGLVNTIRQLREHDPEMGVELANEIVGKLLNERLLKDPEAASLASGLVQLARTWTTRFTRRGKEDTTPKTPLLRDDQYRELVQKMLTEVSSFSPRETSNSHPQERDAAWNLLGGLQSLGPSIETIAHGGEATVKKKQAEMNVSNNVNADINQQLMNTIASGSTEASLEAIAKAPPELKEQSYLQLASQVANSGDFERTKQIINDHISNPYQRRESLNGIEQQRIHHAMSKGKVEEALRTLSGFRNTRDRAQQLVAIIGQIGPGQKRATAMILLEQARAMLSPSVQAQDEVQMNALFEIARSFSRYDPKRAFEIIDPLIDQFNDLSVAARTLEGFGYETFEDGELSLTNGDGIAIVAGQMSRMLGALALIDFDQTKAATDRLRLPEVRLMAYLSIAEQTIQAAK